MTNNNTPIGVFTDSWVFGGHEKMLLNLVRILCKNSEKQFIFFVNLSNRVLIKEIDSLMLNYSEQIAIRKFDFKKSKSFSFLFMPFSFLKLIKELKRLNIWTLIVAQGSIELSVRGLLAGLLLKRCVISYLPYTHAMKSLRLRFSYLRDLINIKLIYQVPNSFIVLDEISKKFIQRITKNKEVFILRNIDILELKPIKEKPFDAKKGRIFIALLGRIYFKQKGQDIALKAVEVILKKGIYDVVLNFYGSGEDFEKLKALINKSDFKENLSLKPYISNISQIYESKDLSLMPSYFEGYPLVFIESMHYNKDFMASNLEVFQPYIKKEFLFQTGNVSSLVITLEYYLKLKESTLSEKDYFTSYKGKIEKKNTDLISNELINFIAKTCYEYYF